MGLMRICWGWIDGTQRLFVIRIWSFVNHSGIRVSAFLRHSSFGLFKPSTNLKTRMTK
jgi:hypothetical protein